VLIELDHSTPIIVDRPLYPELAKGAVKRTVEQLREQAARARTERKQATFRRTGSRSEDPAEDARRGHGRRVRELAEQAHGATLDLGWALMNNLATVDPEDTTVAKFFVLCGLPHRTNYADSPTMPSAPRWPFDGSDWHQSAPLATT
jgi:hypothetical protein